MKESSRRPFCGRGTEEDHETPHFG